jgi:hypothetical protein
VHDQRVHPLRHTSCPSELPGPPPAQGQVAQFDTQATHQGRPNQCQYGLLLTAAFSSSFPSLPCTVVMRPEQALVCCVKESFCPKCLVDSKEHRENILWSDLRPQDPGWTACILKSVGNTGKTTAFKREGLRVTFLAYNISRMASPSSHSGLGMSTRRR